MKLRSVIAAAAIGTAVALGSTACSSDYQPAYVVGRTMCGLQYCVVMSDGDVVSVDQSIWDAVLYGMIISQNSYGGYHFTRGNYAVHSVSTVSYTKYRSVKIVSASSEVSNQRSGNTYNSGGKTYTSSPKYQASQQAARQSSSNPKYTSGKAGYPSQKQGNTPAKTNYSNKKISYPSSKKGY